ncbi:MAG: ABC transporter ATP-binding protein [Planctomycetia bacterium]
MQVQVQLGCDILETPRVAQVRGMFDLAIQSRSELLGTHLLPLEEKPWNIGLIWGASGSGKSTLARALWPEEFARERVWDPAKSILDAFPHGMSILDITALLNSVGFSSAPAWLRPMGKLSTGQQFRVELALALAQKIQSPEGPLVFDEFTSVVDRTVAQIGSAALAKIVRQRKLQFVAVTCHHDVLDWLQPDWTYQPDEQRFEWRCLRHRPDIQLQIFRVRSSAWRLFAGHHYLSHSIAASAVCFQANWKNRPVAFSAWLPFVGKGPPTRREHRTVCLPDFQGVGIGQALSNTVASLWRSQGFRAISTTTHPGLIASRMRSKDWVLKRKPALAGASSKAMPGLKHATTRLTAGFEFVGEPMNPRQGRELLMM